MPCRFAQGTCPLWGDSIAADEALVRKAAEAAEVKWRSEHPEASETRLTISDVVSEGLLSEQHRRQREFAPPLPMAAPIGPGAGHPDAERVRLRRNVRRRRGR